MTYCNVEPSRLIWMLSTTFGKQMFFLTFLTWGLIIVALILLIIFLIRKLFIEVEPKKPAPVRRKR